MSKTTSEEILELVREEEDFCEMACDELDRIRFEISEFKKELSRWFGARREKLANQLEEEFDEFLAALSD